MEALWLEVRAWLEQQWAALEPQVMPYVAGAVVLLLFLSFLTTTSGSGGSGRKKGGRRG